MLLLNVWYAVRHVTYRIVSSRRALPRTFPNRSQTMRVTWVAFIRFKLERIDLKMRALELPVRAKAGRGWCHSPRRRTAPLGSSTRNLYYAWHGRRAHWCAKSGCQQPRFVLWHVGCVPALWSCVEAFLHDLLAREQDGVVFVDVDVFWADELEEINRFPA